MIDQEGQYPLSQEFQKVLLTTAPSTLSPIVDDDHQLEAQDKRTRVDDDLFDLEHQAFDKWVPFLRQSVDKEILGQVTEELRNSIEDNFEGLEIQFLQDSQVNDKLKNSIGQVAKIQDLIDKSLLQDVNALHEELTASTNEVITKKQIYINNKKTSLKISEASILINKVLQILELSNKCQELIVDADFFKALQNLDSLEKIYLQEFKNYDFQFLREIYASIPFLKSTIKDECINLIRNSFNSNLGKNLYDVGESIFKVYNEELVPTWLEKRDSLKLSNYKFNSPVEVSMREEQTLRKMDLERFFHLDEFHDSILIFKSLGEQDYLISEFTKEYNFRKTKIIDPLSWKKTPSAPRSHRPGDLSDDPFAQVLTMEKLKEFFLRILGFLLYDISLQRSTDFIFVNNNYNATNEFWDALTSRLEPYLRFFINERLEGEEDLSAFKEFICVYVAILENHKLNIEPLSNILRSLFSKFCRSATIAFKQEFDVLLNDDDFMPLTINDRHLYEKVLKICWMKEEELVKNQDASADGKDEFFVTLPFSPLYPMTCTLIKKTYTKLTHFIGFFYRHELHKLSSTLVGTIDTIFSKVVNEKIRAKLDTTSREEIAQILINLDYFIIAAKEFSHLMSKENILQNPTIEIRLPAIKKFVESRKYAETKLIELIDSKVSDILETVELDWSATTVRSEPDISIVDIAQFLEMMFSSTLVNLPYSVQTLLIFREFDSLTRQFLDLLLHGTPAQISQESVLNFEVDIQYLESIIPRIFPTSGEENSTISELQSPITTASPTFAGFGRSTNSIENNIKSLEATFTELKQCIELLKQDNFTEYSDPEIRPRKYPRVKPEDASILIRKAQVYSSNATNLDDASRGSLGIDTSGRDSSSNGSRIAKFFNRY